MGEMIQEWTRRSMLLGGTGALLASCSPWANYGYNYLLRIVAEVAGQRVEGSSVIRLDFYDNGLMKGFDAILNYSVHVNGEAPILDTPRGKMFALLLGEYIPNSRFHPLAGYTALRSCLDSTYTGPRLAEVVEYRERVALDANSWPLLVYFSNLADPTTAQLVWSPEPDPRGEPNIRMIEATVEVTDNEVTRRLDRLMPWLADLGENRLTGDKYGLMRDRVFARSLTKQDFEMRGENTFQI
jgi:hypothetical protein